MRWPLIVVQRIPLVGAIAAVHESSLEYRAFLLVPNITREVSFPRRTCRTITYCSAQPAGKDEAERYHKGEVALMVDCEIIEYFPTASDAYDAGCERYGLGNFSIQEIGAAPIGLGAQTLELL